MIQVTSRANDHFKRLSSLATSKGLRKYGEFILMGEKLVREFVREPGAWTVKSELVRPGARPLLGKTATVFEFSEELFKEIDVLGTGFNLVVLRVPDLPKADLAMPAAGLELVCPLGDPSNLGAILRSALAFGVSKVVLTEEAASPFHPKAIKASAGAVLRLTLSTTGALASYRAEGASVALDMGGADVTAWMWPRNVRLIVGEEGPGLPALKNVPRISIPTGPVESLNAAVAASLAMFHYQNQK